VWLAGAGCAAQSGAECVWVTGDSRCVGYWGLGCVCVCVWLCVWLAGAVCAACVKLCACDLSVAKKRQSIITERLCEAKQTYHWLCKEDDKRLWLALLLLVELRMIIILQVTARPYHCA